MSYDQAITIFSPNGHLFQVQYAQQAVKNGLCAVGLVAENSIILAVQKKTATKLQDSRTIKKILRIDDNVCMALTGLYADARILANLTRVMCQSFRLDYDEEPSIQIVAKYIASTKHKYTQRGGVRPFGLSTLISGFDIEDKPHLFGIDPSGMITQWKANACGRNSKQVCEYFEKHYKADISIQGAVKIACQSLMDVVQSGSKNIQLAVMRKGQIKYYSDQQIQRIVKQHS